MVQVTQPVRDRVGLDVGRHLVDEALVSERVLQTLRCPQRPGEKRRAHAVRQHALAAHDTGAILAAADAAGDVGRRGVQVVVERRRRRGRRRARRHGRGLHAEQVSRHHVAGRGIAGTPAAAGRPGLVVPRDDLAVGIQADALVDDEQVSVVLPRHLVLARELHLHRAPNGLRQHSCVVTDGVGAVDAVAARTSHVHHAHAFGGKTEKDGRGISSGKHGLRGRPHRGRIRAHVGDRARAPH